MNAAAIRHLTTADPILGALIAEVGPCDLTPDRARSPFQALVQAAAHQQLNGKAANTILTRFKALFPHGRFPSAQEVFDVDASALASVGFSRAKADYVKGIARMALEGIVPGNGKIKRISDEEIIARLTKIKRVGRRTVEILLIFSLGRPDVLPVDDYGIRQGFAIAYRKRRLPLPDQILRHGERWRSYRTTAWYYLWRAVDLRDGEKPPTVAGGGRKTRELLHSTTRMRYAPSHEFPKVLGKGHTSGIRLLAMVGLQSGLGRSLRTGSQTPHRYTSHYGTRLLARLS